jgi:exopolysaccharide biosynthesis protein
MSRALQEDLKLLGYYTGVIDGSIGPMTRAAVKTFQRMNGLIGDGQAGPATQLKLLEVTYGMTVKWIDRQTLVIQIPKAKLDVISNTKQTVSATYNRLADKPLVLCNGGLFSGTRTMAEIVDGGQVIQGVMSKYVLTDKGALGMYWATANNRIPDEAIGAGPLLTLCGKVHLDLTGFDRRLVESNHPRLALGYDNEYMTLVVVHGRRPTKGHRGCTIPYLADLMLRLGCTDSIGLDGGGSIYVVNRYGRLLNQPTETRRVNHCIALRG